MKLFDTILFSFAVLFMLIGIHQAMMVGFAASYWLFMLALGALLWYQTRKKNQKREETKKDTEKENKASDNSSRKRKYKM
jgi:hypothetical protein